jgi:hypothetical protein
MDAHEQAWAEALAQEHAHQRELLATLRNELGAFARECAGALTALDAFVGLAGVGQILNAARTDVQQASLVLEVGKRFSRSSGDDEVEQTYNELGGNGDVSPPLVRHAAELLKTDSKRTDRELFQAVVSASGARAQIEAIIGPAPMAALQALKPLARWAPALGRGNGRELLGSAAKDLSQVLDGAAQLGAGADAGAGGDAATLADSLRDTVAHVESAMHAVRNGKLEQVLAEARKTLEADLDKLRTIHEGAHDAPAEWRKARRTEHAELTKEVHDKLDKIERIRGVLGTFMPHLQAVARALTSLQKVQALVRRLDPPAAAGVEAAHLSLSIALADLWQAAFARGAHAPPRPRPRVRKSWTAAAAAAIVAIVLAVVLSSGGKSKPAVAPATTAATTTTAAISVPAAPKLSPVSATFVEAQRATFYTINVTDPNESATYSWRLQTPPGNPTCNNFHQLANQPNEAVWHHANTDGCTHNGTQHLGTVYVTITTAHWRCTASFFGTLTHKGQPNQQCARR